VTTYKIRHSTCYEYESPVLHAHHLAHLRPRSTGNQDVLLSEIDVRPSARSATRKRDYFGNECELIEVLAAHECLEVVAHSMVAVRAAELDGLDPKRTPPWEDVASRLRSDLRLVRDREFCFDSPLVRTHPMLIDYAARVFAEGRSIGDAVLELNHRIFKDFKYDPSSTDISTPLGQVMRERRGVCQDFAHVAIGCLRSVGLAARYVSGYLETTPPEGKPRLVGADASHAWVSVLIPELGWLDFDPTNDILPGERHVTVGWGRDFSDVSPLQGVVLGGGRHTLSVGVDVEPRHAA
jgi:transglutaminase-like putative cysteine protease